MIKRLLRNRERAGLSGTRSISRLREDVSVTGAEIFSANHADDVLLQKSIVGGLNRRV